MRSALIILVLSLRAATAQDIPADYRAYLDALQAQAAGRHEAAIKGLDPVWRTQPVSPLTGKAAVAAAQSWLALNNPQNAADILRRHRAELPQPEGDLLLAKAANDPGVYEDIFYRYPLSKEAEEAETALAGMKDIPPAMPQAVLERAEKLRRAGQSAKARAELLAAASSFTGLAKEQALVRANFYDYRALTNLSLKEPEADAERIYLMHAAARRGSQVPAAEAALAQLEKKYPKSSWTMEALISLGNHWVLRNEPARYVPLYRRCYQNFGDDKQAAYCHWKVAWASWMAREPGARRLLEEHLVKFPTSEKSPAALYFLGRYSEVVSKWPMSYYTALARAKLKAVPVSAARPDPEVFTATESTRARIHRAKQLERTNLPEWAEFELRFAGNQQPYVAAIELSEAASRRGAYGPALRYVKSYARGYLTLPLEAAPERFWKAAFPMPFKPVIDENAKREGLDPELVAALIRQESEFDPGAVSRTKALGLMQIMPSTGRELYRRLGLGMAFSNDKLFDPVISIRMGTHYLKGRLDANNGSWEETLASYNAGQSRVAKWNTWYRYREPAEFVECIPFTETREYVQVVLRNADVYRRVYLR